MSCCKKRCPYNYCTCTVLTGCKHGFVKDCGCTCPAEPEKICTDCHKPMLPLHYTFEGRRHWCCEHPTEDPAYHDSFAHEKMLCQAAEDTQ